MTGSEVDVEVSTVVRRRVEEVAAFANDPTNAPQWYANIDEVAWRSEPPARVGSEVAFVARFLGRELRYTYEIVELSGAGLVMRTAQGPFAMETAYRYEALPDGSTRMWLRNRGTPTGFSRWLAPFIGAAMRRATTKDLAALKRLLEGGGHLGDG